MQNYEREGLSRRMDRDMLAMVGNVASRHRLPSAILVFNRDRMTGQIWSQGMQVDYTKDGMAAFTLPIRNEFGDNIWETTSFIVSLANNTSDIPVLCDREFVDFWSNVRAVRKVEDDHFRMQSRPGRNIDIFIPLSPKEEPDISDSFSLGP